MNESDRHQLHMAFQTIDAIKDGFADLSRMQEAAAKRAVPVRERFRVIDGGRHSEKPTNG